MKVLVTGGAGYIGSHAAKALYNSGNDVVVLDNLSRGNKWAAKWGPLEVGDIRDVEMLTRLFRKHKIDAVLHFAALAYVGESMQDPLGYYSVNVEGSVQLLRAMQAHDVKLIVFSSTCATYGTPDAMPISESTPQRPVNPYGATKLAVEQMLEWTYQIDGLHYMALRYFNAAGADPDGEIGEHHDPETHVIPRLLDAAAGRSAFQVFGNDFPTSDGTAVRDYIHVSDLADAHVKALDYLASGGPSRALNLGTGRGTSVRDLIKKVDEVTGNPLLFESHPRRAGDPAELVADASLARTVLGWQPRYSSTDQIVQTAWAWHSKDGR